MAIVSQTTDFSFSKKFISGEGYYGLWNAVSKGFGVINTFFIVSSLTVYQYGVFQLLLSIFAIASSLSSLGSGVVGNDVVRYVGQGEERKAKKLFFEYHGARLLVGVLFSLVLWFGSPVMLSFGYKADFILFFKILAVLLILEIWSSIAKPLLKIRLSFSAAASRSALYKIVQAAALLLFFLFSEIGMKEVLLSLVIGSVVSTFFMLRPLLAAFRPWRGIAVGGPSMLFPVLRTHGKWEIMNQFVSKIPSYAEPWLIKFFISTEAVGIFNVAVALAGTFKNFLVTNTFSTLVARRSHQKEWMRDAFRYGTKYIVLLGFTLTAAGLLAATVFVPLFFPAYVAALPLFFVLIFEIPIQGFWRVTEIYLAINQERKFMFMRTASRVVVTLLLYLALVPLMGLWGLVATSMIITSSLAFSSHAYFVKRYPGYRIYLRDLLVFGSKDRELARLFFKSFGEMVKAKWGITWFLKRERGG